MLVRRLTLLIVLWVSVPHVSIAQTVTGIVRDPNGGVLPGATVELIDTGSRRISKVVTGRDGAFTVPSVPPGNYRVHVTVPGFAPYDESITLTDTAPPPLDIVLPLSHMQEQVSVQGTASVVDTTPTAHVDRRLIDTLPSESVSSGLSSLVTLTSPGVAADSNGVFHPLGEHAETSFNIDSQPVSDQQSRIFSNQLSPNAIQSIDVLTGVPPAEFGDKTSLVANVTTRSGLNAHRATGSASLGFGSFQTPTASLSLASVDTQNRQLMDTSKPAIN